MTIQAMIATHPRKGTQVDPALLSECVAAAFECAQSCAACADACVAEEQVAALRRCIRLCLDCSDICDVTAKALSRQTEPDVGLLRAQVKACVEACSVCGQECLSHANEHEHCRECGETCRRCEEACQRLLAAL